MSQFSKGSPRGPGGPGGNKPVIGANRPASGNNVTSKVPAAPPAKGGTGMAAKAGAKYGPAPAPPRGNNAPPVPPKPARGNSAPPAPGSGNNPPPAPPRPAGRSSSGAPPVPPRPTAKVAPGATGMAARAGAKLGPAPGRPNSAAAAAAPPAPPAPGSSSSSAGGNNFVKGVKPGGPKQGLTQGVNKSGTDRLPLGYGGNARGKAIVGSGNKIGKTIPAGPNAKMQSKQP